MKYFKEMTLGTSSIKPTVWPSHVDDTFIHWPHLSKTSGYMNSVNFFFMVIVLMSVHLTVPRVFELKLIARMAVMSLHFITEMAKCNCKFYANSFIFSLTPHFSLLGLSSVLLF